MSNKRKTRSVKRKRKIKPRRHDYHVYILSCADGTFYTGYTSDLNQRLKTHNSGRGAKYLKGKLPAQLAYAKRYRYYKLAILEERRIKQLTRKGKEKLVAAWDLQS